MPQKILIIDDDDLVRELLVRYFVGQGCTMRDVATLDAARTALQDFEPDIILSDVLLVEGTGLDLFYELDSALQERVIFMTGYAGFVRRKLQATGRPVVRKPFRLEALWALMQKIAAQ